MEPSSQGAKIPLALAVALFATLAGCADATGPAAANDAGDDSARAPSVEFESVEEAGLAASPHIHDYWSGRERVTLLDEEITIQPTTALVWGVMTTRFLGETSFGGAFVEFPEGAIVYEGTGRMEITVTWTDPSITGMRFLHRHAGSGEVQPWTAAPPGETVVLEVEPAMTDMPHAQTSRWIFLMAASGTPAVAIGTFHVRIDIVKTRDVTEWPAHPDLWQGELQLVLADAEGQAARHVAPVALVDNRPWAVPADALLAQELVPMEATRLRAVVTILEHGDSLGVAHPRLLVRTASDPEFDFDDQGEPKEVSDDGKTWTWERAVEMDETDNPYAEASAWAFRVVWGAADAPLPECEHGCYQAELRYRLVATIERTLSDP